MVSYDPRILPKKKQIIDSNAIMEVNEEDQDSGASSANLHSSSLVDSLSSSSISKKSCRLPHIEEVDDEFKDGKLHIRKKKMPTIEIK